LAGALNGSKDMDLGLVGHGDTLGPGRFDVGEAQRPAVILSTEDDDPAAVVDQIRLTEPRPILGPIRLVRMGMQCLSSVPGLVKPWDLVK
jgi:hypothetical protein